MGCDTSYLYWEIFNKCGETIRALLLDPLSIIADPPNQEYTNYLDPSHPDFERYPIYETVEAYDSDTINPFKGQLVWSANRYFSSIRDEVPDSGYSADATFYVVPSFGDVTIRSNVEYKQLLAVTFDSNVDIDHDPYGSKIVCVINTFINNVNGSLEKYGNELQIGGGRSLYTRVAKIVKSRTENLVFERRVVLIELRYCHCY